MKRFRQSRCALLIDLILVLTGITIIKGILIGGFPAVWHELKRYPSDFKRNWKTAGWFKG